MAEVVSIHGGPLDLRKASNNVVTLLEEKLEQAKSGEITGIAMAFTYFDRSSGHRRCGFVDTQLVGSTAVLLHDLTRMIEDGQ
jgi:hypothetical protein